MTRIRPPLQIFREDTPLPISTCVSTIAAQPLRLLGRRLRRRVDDHLERLQAVGLVGGKDLELGGIEHRGGLGAQEGVDALLVLDPRGEGLGAEHEQGEVLGVERGDDPGADLMQHIRQVPFLLRRQRPAGRGEPLLQGGHLDAVVLGFGADMRYLTGYAAPALERLTMLVIPANGAPSLIVPRLEAGMAGDAPAMRGGHVARVAWGETDDPFALVAAAVRAGARAGTAPISVAVSDRLWASFVLRLDAALAAGGAAAPTRLASSVLSAIRMVKAPEEVALLRAAGRAVDSVVLAITRGKLLGRSESDVAREVRARTGKRGADVVVDNSGTASWPSSLGALGRRGRLVTCGGTTGPMVQVDVRRMFWNQWTLMGSTMGSEREFRDVIDEFVAGRLTMPVDSVFPVEQGHADAPQALVQTRASRRALYPCGSLETTSEFTLAAGGGRKAPGRPATPRRAGRSCPR